MDLRSGTRLQHQILPVYARGGSELLVVVLKASFRLSSAGAELHAAPLPIFVADQRLPSGATKYPGDVALSRRGTDVVCVGTAWAPGGKPTAVFDASLQVGEVARTVRLFGRRVWQRDGASWRASPPEPSASVPLSWEHSFGGDGVAGNPVGVGWRGEPADAYEGAELPCVEDPSALVQKPGDRPPPAGFGAVAPHWKPRSKYAGTYDDAWKRTCAPFLPDDFDDRFFQTAAPGLTTHVPLKGGEPVRLVNLTREGLVETKLPRVAARVIVDRRRHEPNLDLVVLEPDEDRVTLTFRTTLDVTGRLDDLPKVAVVELRVAPLGERTPGP